MGLPSHAQKIQTCLFHSPVELGINALPVHHLSL